MKCAAVCLITTGCRSTRPGIRAICPVARACTAPSARPIARPILKYTTADSAGWTRLVARVAAPCGGTTRLSSNVTSTSYMHMVGQLITLVHGSIAISSIGLAPGPVKTARLAYRRIARACRLGPMVRYHLQQLLAGHSFGRFLVHRNLVSSQQRDRVSRGILGSISPVARQHLRYQRYASRRCLDRVAQFVQLCHSDFELEFVPQRLSRVVLCRMERRSVWRSIRV